MDFEKLKEKMAEEINKRLEGREVETREVLQNNKIRKFALAVHSPEAKASSLIYLERHYEAFCRGKGFPEVVQEIYEECNSHRLPEGLERFYEFCHWSRAREMLGIKVVNYKKNQGLLEMLPHRRFLDLAAVYCCMADLAEGGRGTALVNKSHMRMWGIQQEELERCAYASHRRRGKMEIKSINEAILEIGGCSAWEAKENMGAGPVRVHVASDTGNVCGASILLFPGEFETLAEHYGSDLYLLPSSIYEVMALPADGEEPRELSDMVREINQTQVLPEEQLSDSVYRYSRESREITLAWEWKEEQLGKRVKEG